jgi:hypothetical protein
MRHTAVAICVAFVDNASAASALSIVGVVLLAEAAPRPQVLRGVTLAAAPEDLLSTQRDVPSREVSMSRATAPIRRVGSTGFGMCSS